MTDRKTALWGITDADDKIFLSRMCDLLDRSDTTGMIMYSRFLTPKEQMLVTERLSQYGRVEFWGGYDDADRKICAFISNDWEETVYPVTALKIIPTNHREYSHRDYLGSVLGLGITRELTGDIATGSNGAVMAVMPEIADFIIMNLTKVASASVRVERTDDMSLFEGLRRYMETGCTVSSMRLDCVVSSAIGKSRSQTSDMIEQGLVFVNYQTSKNPSMLLKEGDVISVRGHGKLILSKIGDLTKKGRVHIEIKKYI